MARTLKEPPVGAPVVSEPVDYRHPAEKAIGLLTTAQLQAEQASQVKKATSPDRLSHVLDVLGSEINIDFRRCTRADMYEFSRQYKSRATHRAESGHPEEASAALYIISQSLENLANAASDPEPALRDLAARLTSQFSGYPYIMDECEYILINVIHRMMGAMINTQIEKLAAETQGSST